ncbi:ABC transporter permease [Clostridium sp. 'deep sea']|uniref:FtsX-like permease family protein n=1 Tax=Clostridium sp. 'deep sea' TaxID=2779445 RepID=UPI0018964C38|nr:FtsX-like permease family protein [Clostridium sp. 'deep sea']QOR35870.1 ABC transporter permease [Clostridium sp. 'deep sea']
MTLGSITLKMFKTDAKKYKLFILCNLCAIAILYSFTSIYVNKQFMNSSIVNPMISSNIYAPTMLVFFFTGIFITYSQSVFIKSRQKDYGILLSIGMTENEVLKSVLLENITMILLALGSGLILGTGLSLLFFSFIKYLLGFSVINITISIVSYKIIIIYVLSVFIFSIILNVIFMCKRTILDKIKYTEKAEKSSCNSIILAVLGLLFTVASIVIMIVLYQKDSNYWFLSLLTCVLGSVLIFYNGEAIIKKFQKKNNKKYLKNIFLFSDLKYYYGKNKKIYLTTTWLFFVILFLFSFSLYSYPSLTSNAITYHPYHMTYAGIDNDMQALAKNEIENIALHYGNKITAYDSVKFMRNNTFTIFDVNDINTIFNESYCIDSNTCLFVFPYDINDGYDHNTNQSMSTLRIKTNTTKKEFNITNTIVKPFFGHVNCISSYIILVNSEDYNWISKNGVDYYIKGRLQLYNFEYWRNSQNIINDVWNKLLIKNNINEDDNFFKISSLINAYKIALKSSNFLLFIVIYVCLLIYLSTVIMIYFKVEMEYEDDKKKYFSLYRLGITNKEINKMVSQKIKTIFSISFIYAIIINIGYSYLMSSLRSLFYALLTTLAFASIHFIVYRLCINNYYKRLEIDLGYKNNY